MKFSLTSTLLFLATATSSVLATPTQEPSVHDLVRRAAALTERDPAFLDSTAEILARQILDDYSEDEDLLAIDPASDADDAPEDAFDYGSLGQDVTEADVEYLARRSLGPAHDEALSALLKREPGFFKKLGKKLKNLGKKIGKGLKKVGNVIVDVVTGAIKCDVLDCARALAPTVKECGEVVAGKFTLDDGVECIREAVKLGKNLPSSCKECRNIF